ncbi:MAG: putative manganese transporter [Bacteroidales bacterium]
MYSFLEPLKEALQISFFVMIIMMLMEFFQLWQMSKHTEKHTKMEGVSLHRGKKYFGKLGMALLLGLIPGCVGGFAAVSMYSHGLISFGAVLAASFTALGDDAFRMLAMMPEKVLYVEVLLLILGLICALAVDYIPYFRRFTPPSAEHIQLHRQEHEHEQWIEKEENGIENTSYNCWPKIKDWSLARTLLVSMLLFYMYALLGGWMGHEHSPIHAQESHSLLEWNFENILLIVFSLAALILIVRANEHFLQEHLWKHVLKKHFLPIFLWTVGTLYVILALNHFFDLNAWLQNDISKMFIVLMVAVVVGWIPQSGPHFIFIQLFFTSLIPFSVFFANAIVQDGHTSLVLLAESRKQFLWLKAIKSVVALSIGSLGLWIGF